MSSSWQVAGPSTRRPIPVKRFFCSFPNFFHLTFDSFNVDETTLAIDENSADATVSPALYQIDPLTEVAILVGPTNLFLGASVEVGGKFYAFKGVITGFAGGFPEGYNELIILDLATGKVIFVRNIDVNAGVIFGAAPMHVLAE